MNLCHGLKNYFLLLLILISLNIKSQIGGAFTIPGNFPTIAAAINTLNTLGVAAPVTINIAAGYTETATTGGLKLNSIPGASATNSVIFTKSGAGANPIVYAYSGGTATSNSQLQDGIWLFTGTDYVTIDGIDVTDLNSSGNSMMEFGYGLFRYSQSDGCQHNTIRNCVITLNRLNLSTGIMLSPCTGSNNSISVVTNSVSGSNSYNRVYSNSIQNCFMGVGVSAFVSNSATNGDNYNDIGGSSAATGNTIKNFGNAVVGGAEGIHADNQYNFNASYNVITNNDGSGAYPTTLYGLYNQAVSQSTVTIRGNTLTLSGSASTTSMTGIYNFGSGILSQNKTKISGNLFTSFSFPNTSAVETRVINSIASGISLNVDSNAIGNVSMNTGSLALIYVNLASTFDATSNTLTTISCQSTQFYGMRYAAVSSSASVTKNLIDNISHSGTGNILQGISGSGSSSYLTIGSNTISNITSTFYFRFVGISETSTHDKLISDNKIYNIQCQAKTSGPLLTGISVIANSVAFPQVASNQIYSLSITSPTANISGHITGIDFPTGASGNVKVNANKLHSFFSDCQTDITGISASASGYTFTLSNNLIGAFSGINSTDITGVYGYLGNTLNLYYNTIYINQNSSNYSDFSSEAVHCESTCTVALRNNIFVNSSIATGSGKTYAFKSEASALTNYSTSSNNNIFYAGPPSLGGILYGNTSVSFTTLPAFKNYAVPRESQSFTEPPPFISTTGLAPNFLSLDPTLATQAESTGQPIASFTTDYAGTTRNTVTPDLGAWEGPFLQGDITAPTVTSQGFLGGECSLSGRTFTAQITDASGVATTGTAVPLLYYKLNLGLYSPVQGSLIAGTAANGTWSFTITYSANANDVVYYFLALQDQSPYQNYTLLPSVAGATLTGVTAITTPPPSSYNYTIAPVQAVGLNSGILCLGNNYTLTPSGASTYTISGGQAVVSPTTTTSYTVTGTGSVGCVSSTMAVATITVVAPPTISVSNGTLCSGKVFTISPTGASSYTYQGGSATVTPIANTSYTLIGADSYGCLSNTAIATVSVSTTPTVSVNSGTICQGNAFTISASGAASYSWDAASAGGSFTQVVVSPSATAIYTLTGTTGQCFSSAATTVYVNPAAAIPTISPGTSSLGCSSITLTASPAGNTWTPMTNLTGVGRMSGVGFSIGNKGYVGLGYNPNLSQVYNDFWEYDPATNSWSQKNNYPGSGRIDAVGFGIDALGYLGTGLTSASGSATRDFWEYNPAANTWTPKANFSTTNRSGAACFVLNGKGYVGTGSSGSYLADFWEYNPATDIWTQKTNVPGGARSLAGAFAIGSKGYLGMGMQSSFPSTTFYEFDPVANSWTTKASFPGSGPLRLKGFALGNRGYLGTGWSNIGTGVNNQFWEYNPAGNAWTQKTNFAGGVRYAVSAFAIGNYGYMGLGNDNLSGYYQDLWRYEQGNTLLWSSNGSTLSAITTTASGLYTTTLTNVYGCQSSTSQSVNVIPIPTLTIVSAISPTFGCSGASNTLTATGATNYTWSGNAGTATTATAIVNPTTTTSYTVTGATAWCTSSLTTTLRVIASPTAGILTSVPAVVCGTSLALSTNTVPDNYWAPKASFGATRGFAVGFSIGAKGYIGTGNNGSTGSYWQDFWEYDPATNTWTQKANFGGGTREGCVGFGIGAKGYIATGTGNPVTDYRDIWEYNPTANTWTQKISNMGTYGRRYGFVFVVGAKAYIGGGYSYSAGTNLSDFWEYDPSTNVVTAKAALPAVRQAPYAFASGTMGYVGGGSASSGNLSDFWEYNPTLNQWTQKSSPAAQYAVEASGFYLNNKGYLMNTGSGPGMWEYDAPTDTWTQKPDFIGDSRQRAATFVLGSKAYMGTGLSYSTGYLNDLWEYAPATNTFVWSTGSSSPAITVTTSGTYSLTITNAYSCSATFAQPVIVTPPLSLSITGSSVICQGQTVSLTASGAASYTWDVGAGNATSTVVNVQPTSSVAYSLTGAANGCTATISKSVTVNTLPSVSGSATNSVICSGNLLTLNGSGASTYSWSGAVVNNTAFVANTSSNYTVTGTDANNCSNTAVVSVTVNPSPTITVNSGSICVGQSFTITPANAVTYTVQGGNTVVSPNTTAIYTVAGTASNGCVSNTYAIASVTVNISPIITAASGSICAGNFYTINPGGAATYTYSNGSAIVSPTSTASYSVTGTSSAGCIGNAPALLTVTVNALPTVSVNSGSICSGNNFTMIPTGASTYTYSGGSAIVSPGASLSYSVTGTSTAGCVSASPAIANVTVLTSPTVTANSGSICAGQAFTINPGGANTYSIQGGNTVVSPGTSTTYAVAGTASNGCVSGANAIASVTVNAIPVITAPSGSICSGRAYTISPSGAATYTYSGGAAIVSPTVTASYSVTGTSTAGCVSSAPSILSVTVNAIPTLSVNSGTICSGNSFTMNPSGASTYTYSSGSAIVFPGSSASYSVTGTSTAGCIGAAPAISNITVLVSPTVSVNSGSICAGQSFTISPANAATYTIQGGNTVVSPTTTSTYTVVGTAGNGCISNSNAIVTVTVNANPSITATSGSICAGNSFTINPVGASTYTYANGSAIVSPTSTTSYSVTGTNTAGCVSAAAAVVNVTVNTLPTLTVNSGSICSGGSFTINASGAFTYTYSGGSSVVSPGTSASYSVTGTSTAGCAGSPAIANVTVLTSPTISVNSGSICAGQSFTITPANAATYTVQGGTAVVSPTSTTTYSVSGTASNGCVSNSNAVASVTVNANPTITASSGSICAGSSFTINPGGAATYSYSSVLAIVSPTNTTSYSVTGTSTAGCVGATPAIVTVTVNAVPIVATNSGSICSGRNFTINPSGASSYTVSGGSFIVSPSTNTVYNVVGTSSNGCNSAPAITSLTVIASPVVNVNSGAICNGQAFALVPGGAANYTISGGAATVSPVSTTTYSVIGSNTLGCVSSNTAIATVTVFSLPVIAIVGPTAVCLGNTSTLSATGGTSYVWNPGGTATTLTISPLSTGVYVVTGTDINGCVGSTQKTVAVNPVPIVTVVGSTAICQGQSASLNAGGTAITFTWNTGAIGNLLTVSPTLSTVYSAIGGDLNGCTNTATLLVFVNSLPVISANASSTSICTGGSVSLSSSGASSYTWSGGINGTTPFYPTVSTTYTVTGTSINNCSNSATVMIVVNPLPQVHINGQDTICKGATATFTASGANIYSWNTGQVLPTLTVSADTTTVYSLTGTDSHGCSATVTHTLVTDICLGIKKTARDAGINMFPNPCTGLIHIHVNNYTPDLEVEIYDALSQIIFSSKLTSQDNLIDVRNVANGLYVVKVATKGKTLRQEKMIKTE